MIVKVCGCGLTIASEDGSFMVQQGFTCAAIEELCMMIEKKKIGQIHMRISLDEFDMGINKHNQFYFGVDFGGPTIFIALSKKTIKVLMKLRRVNRIEERETRNKTNDDSDDDDDSDDIGAWESYINT